MGWLDKLLGRQRSDVMVEDGPDGGTVTLRNREVAAMLEAPAEPNFGGDASGPCGRCGGQLDEAFITTGGVHGDPLVWRDHPVAVDGWACVGCGVFRYPRKVSPERIAALNEQGAQHGRAGEVAPAELCFARIVWDWPGYFMGHMNYAESTRERIAAEEHEPLVARRLTQRMAHHYEAAVDAAADDPATAPVAALSRACLTLAELAITDNADSRARRFLETCLRIDALPAETRAHADALMAYIDGGGRELERASQALMPYLLLQDREEKKIESGDDRETVNRAIAALEKAQHKDGGGNWRIAWLTAKAFEALGDVERALAVFGDAFDAHRGEAAIARDYSLLLLRHARNDEARSVARAAAHAHPDDAKLLCNHAVTELLCGDLDAAETALSHSTRIDPEDHVAIALGRKLRAIRDGAPVPATLAEMERRFSLGR